ncbi:MAG: sigma-70 family RNA polymerase sigma factor [Vicinamibacteraceae bacterium]
MRSDRRRDGVPPRRDPTDEAPDVRVVDLEVVQRMSAGDAAALGELYDRHARAVYSLACRILSDDRDAEDVVQDVFTQAWRQATRFDARRGPVVAWLLMIARARAIDRLRGREVRPGWTASGEQSVLSTLSDAQPDQETEAITSERAGRVRDALDELPDGHRQAITLAYYEGLTQEEIAERLRQPLGTVKTRIRSGLLKLRAALERE